MAREQNPHKILFLCTGNSARSIFAEYLMKKFGKGRFEAYSAGSQPTGTINPFTIRVLREEYNIDAPDARSKSWDEFKDGHFDIIITVCDKAKESCPVFPGQPIIAHWNIADPAVTTGTNDAKLFQFRKAAMEIRRRIDLLCSFPIEKIGHLLTQSTQGAEAEKAN
jgi:arsenate reductase (thioredoxin)